MRGRIKQVFDRVSLPRVGSAGMPANRRRRRIPGNTIRLVASPDTHYIDRDGSTLAYQVFGSGPAEFFFFANVNQHLDLLWSDPQIAAVWDRLARRGRVATAQRRGVGLSDRIDYVPTLEQQAGDIVAVMNAAELRQPVLLAAGSACGPIAMVAAQHPTRVKGLVLYDIIPEAIDGDIEDSAATDEERRRAKALFDQVVEQWGTGGFIRLWNPDLVSPLNTRMMALLERSSLTPAEAKAHFGWARSTDLRDLLPTVRVPTRVIVTPGGAFTESWARQAADLMPDATLQVAPHVKGMSIGEAFDVVPIAGIGLALGEQEAAADERFLGTVLFTDIVASTDLLARVGDQEYKRLRVRHERAVRLAAEQAGARVVTITGDGSVAVYDGPSQAVRAAERITHKARADGVAIRCGVHTGELQRDGANVAGITVHIGARVMEAAESGQIVVSRTVRDLVVGSGLELVSLGERQLKGVPDRWELFAVSHAGDQEGTVEGGKSIQTPLDKFAVQSARHTPFLSRLAVRFAQSIDRRTR